MTQAEIGQVFGASLWPIAVTMILFSLVVDRTGYKLPMFVAFAMQAISGFGTWMADSYGLLLFSALCAGLGHGIVEAVINPICAAVYPKEKTKWLTILHAAWPAGLVLGTLLVVGGDALFGGLDWFGFVGNYHLFDRRHTSLFDNFADAGFFGNRLLHRFSFGNGLGCFYRRGLISKKWRIE